MPTAPTHSPLPAAPARRWPLLLLRDALVWGGLLALMWLTLPRVPAAQYAAVRQSIIVFMLLAPPAVYGHNLVLLPHLFDKGRYGRYVAALLAWSLVLHGVARVGWPHLYSTPLQPAVNWLLIMLLSMGLLLIWRAVVQRRQLARRHLLEREQQLRLLEAQVNPHFLFNTLNSLYALSLRQHPRTPDLIMALAELMRYQLESTRRPAVPLAAELEYLRSYGQLQEVRLGPRCPVQLELPPPEAAAGLTVPPLLLLALIENAFTHGTRRAQGSFVSLRLHLDGRRLHLHARNALPPGSSSGAGTGLPNTRQRLALLYPGRHHLRAEPAPDGTPEFITELTLDL
mgnify:FL=1